MSTIHKRAKALHTKVELALVRVRTMPVTHTQRYARTLLEAVEHELSELTWALRPNPDANPTPQPPHPDELADAITPRQTAIMRLTALGLTVDEIGERLRISPFTAKTQRGLVLRRLHARNAAHAVHMLTKHGVI